MVEVKPGIGNAPERRPCGLQVYATLVPNTPIASKLPGASPIVPSLTRLAGLSFWLALAAALFVALSPSAISAPEFGNDKIMHFTAFAALSVLACLAYGVRRPILLGVGLSAFGAMIEVLQGLPLFHRDADVADWLVDTLAVVLVISIAWLVSAAFAQREATPRIRN